MKAVVLVGGEGTRLRPLTETIPKPLLPLVDRAFLHHVLDRLGGQGVDEVLLSSSYLEAAFRPFLEERPAHPRVTWVSEGVPLGTGGAVVNALGLLEETFIVVNGDVLTDLEVAAMVEYHRERAALGTIAVTAVPDARPYGLVVVAEDGRIGEFREKPTQRVPGLINAGTYVLEPPALRGWGADFPLSIERQVYPALIERGDPLFAFASQSYWLDVGTPENYLTAHFDLLEGKVKGVRYDAPWVGPRADVDLRAHLGRWVAVGEGASVGPDAEVDDSVLHPGARVGAGAQVFGSILGPECEVGEGAIVCDSILAQGARAAAGSRVVQARVSAGGVVDVAM